MKEKIISALFVGAISLLSPLPALAAAPEFGTVIEGLSIPGIVALGDTRALVEATYGAPEACQDQTVYESEDRGYDAICDFDVIGGGQVTIYYEDSDGGLANGTQDDITYFMRWTETADGWFTSAGVNTTLADEDSEVAAAAYPDAEVLRFEWGSIWQITDYWQGIRILRSPNFYAGTVTVSMSIFHPTAPPPPPPPREKTVRVSDIDLSIVKRTVEAAVRILDDRGWSGSGALVKATWTLPDGSTRSVNATTEYGGWAQLDLNKARRGQYTLTIDNVVLDDHNFDPDNSVLSASIVKQK
ncbi:MAG: hypothetical protein OEU84_03775 [Xanthomonadales bacterium]|nr:hypothetical protein [Xanthomonadales bacterium]